MLVGKEQPQTKVKVQPGSGLGATVAASGGGGGRLCQWLLEKGGEEQMLTTHSSITSDYFCSDEGWTVENIMNVEQSPGGKGYEKCFVLRRIKKLVAT